MKSPYRVAAAGEVLYEGRFYAGNVWAWVNAPLGVALFAFASAVVTLCVGGAWVPPQIAGMTVASALALAISLPLTAYARQAVVTRVRLVGGANLQLEIDGRSFAIAAMLTGHQAAGEIVRREPRHQFLEVAVLDDRGSCRALLREDIEPDEMPAGWTSGPLQIRSAKVMRAALGRVYLDDLVRQFERARNDATTSSDRR